MASNIGNNAQFTTTNMKPESGEQLDALWGTEHLGQYGIPVLRASQPIQGFK